MMSNDYFAEDNLLSKTQFEYSSTTAAATCANKPPLLFVVVRARVSDVSLKLPPIKGRPSITKVLNQASYSMYTLMSIFLILFFYMVEKMAAKFQM